MSAALEQMDILEAIRQAEGGMATAIRNANLEYRDQLEHAIEILARAGKTFSADDVQFLTGARPLECSPNLIGAVINAAAKAGLIEPVGFVRSGRVIGHGNRLIVWKGRA
jgi:hypothetical protein